MCTLTLYSRHMSTINASRFRAECLTLLDDLPREGIWITKRGRAVARLMPVKAPRGKVKPITSALIEGKGSPGPAMGEGLTTPYDLIFA